MGLTSLRLRERLAKEREAAANKLAAPPPPVSAALPPQAEADPVSVVSSAPVEPVPQRQAFDGRQGGGYDNHKKHRR